MKKVIFFLSVALGLVISDQVAQASSYSETAYKRSAFTEVKIIASAVPLNNDQFLALLDLNERRLKDMDAARFYFSSEPELYDQTVAELNALYHKEIKDLLKPHQYKAILSLAENHDNLVTLAR